MSIHIVKNFAKKQNKKGKKCSYSIQLEILLIHAIQIVNESCYCQSLLMRCESENKKREEKKKQIFLHWFISKFFRFAKAVHSRRLDHNI